MDLSDHPSPPTFIYVEEEDKNASDNDFTFNFDSFNLDNNDLNEANDSNGNVSRLSAQITTSANIPSTTRKRSDTNIVSIQQLESKLTKEDIRVRYHGDGQVKASLFCNICQLLLGGGRIYNTKLPKDFKAIKEIARYHIMESDHVTIKK